jgi:hypothetical protein
MPIQTREEEQQKDDEAQEEAESLMQRRWSACSQQPFCECSYRRVEEEEAQSSMQCRSSACYQQPLCECSDRRVCVEEEEAESSMQRWWSAGSQHPPCQAYAAAQRPAVGHRVLTRLHQHPHRHGPHTSAISTSTYALLEILRDTLCGFDD